MKKLQNFFSWVYIAILLLGILVSFRMVAEGIIALELSDFPGKGLLCVLLALVVTVLFWAVAIELNAIMATLVKIFIGLLCGFRFLVFRWYNWRLYRENEKIKSKWVKGARVGMVYHMVPPEQVGETYPLLLFHCGEVIWNVLVVLVCGVIFFVFGNKASLSVTFFFILGFEAGFVNVIGFLKENLKNLDNLFYGYSKPWVKKVVWQLGQIWYSIKAQGKIRFREMSDEWFEWSGEYDIINKETDELAYFRLRYLMNKERYAEALQLGRDIVEPKGEWFLTRRQATVTVLYCLMVLEEDKRVIKEWYRLKQELLRIMNDIGTYRTCYLYFQYIDYDGEKAERYRRLFDEAIAKETDAEKIEFEQKYIRIIAEKWEGNV